MFVNLNMMMGGGDTSWLNAHTFKHECRMLKQFKFLHGLIISECVSSINNKKLKCNLLLWTLTLLNNVASCAMLFGTR